MPSLPSSLNALRPVLGVLLGHLRRSPGTALGTIAAMAAGVAVFVAIFLAGEAARSSFVSAVEAVAGKATHEVSAESGIPEKRFSEVSQHPSVLHAQPVVEGRARALAAHTKSQRRTIQASPLRLLGIDPLFVGPFFATPKEKPVIPSEAIDRFLTEPGMVVLSQPWAAEAGVSVGDVIEVGVSGHIGKLTVMGIYPLMFLGEAARDTAVVDIATAQELFGRIGKLDRIDLILQKNAEEPFRSSLQKSESLKRPVQRGESVAKMVEAFRLNLLALGFLALMVGALLIFNAAQYSVIRREGLLGQLRSLGVTRPVMLLAVLGEVVLFGLLGAVLGITLGTALAQTLVQSVTETITNLYAFVHVDSAPLSWPFALAMILGAGFLSALAGFFPALDAARTEPRMVGLRSHKENTYRVRLPRLLLLAVFGALVAAGGVFSPFGTWWPGLVAALGCLTAGAALLPLIMNGMLPKLKQSGERLGALHLALASGALHRSLSRTGGAAAALSTALAMTIGVIVMVYSFEMEVRTWIRSAIQADIYLSDAAGSVQRNNARVPDEALQLVRTLKGVRAIETLRGLEVALEANEHSGSIFFCGADWSEPESRAMLDFVAGDPDTAFRRALKGDALISEPFANRYGKHIGDSFEVLGRQGRRAFKVAGIFRDFSYDRGFAVTGIKPFLETFDDPGARNARIYLKSGYNVDEVATEIRRTVADRFFLNVRSNLQLRDRILEVFDATFAVTYLLQFIATFIALAGISITLFSLFLERAHEIATLRALGAEVGYITRLFATESLVMSLFPILLSLPLGAILAWVLIDVVNLRSFGWTITFRWPWDSVLLTCLFALGAACLATLVPWVLARRQSIALALREE